MERRDGIQTELQFLRMENVRLTNEKVSREEYVRFLEEENRSVEKEIRQEFEMKLVLLSKEREHALKRAKEAESKVKAAENEVRKAQSRTAHAEQMLEEARLAFRKEWGVPIVDRIMEMLGAMRSAVSVR